MAKAIQIERLPESARNELYDFYEFLVQKYVPVLTKSSSESEVKERFFKTVASRVFSLPANYTFDRRLLEKCFTPCPEKESAAKTKLDPLSTILLKHSPL